MSKACENCGSYGHSALYCPLRTLEMRKNPFGLASARKPSRPPSDPADRDTNANTIFLTRPERLV